MQLKCWELSIRPESFPVYKNIFHDPFTIPVNIQLSFMNCVLAGYILLPVESFVLISGFGSLALFLNAFQYQIHIKESLDIL